MWVASVCLLALFNPLFAQEVLTPSNDTAQSAPAQSPPTQSPPAPLYGLAGRVVNALTGESIPRVKVSLAQRATLTAADGAFQFANVPAGQYAAGAEKPGYFAANALPQSNHMPDIFTVGPQMPPLILKLVPAAVITGSIRDQAGEPLAQIPVEIFRHTLQNGRFHWMQAGQAVSREDGDFRIPDLMPDTYLLRYGPHWTTSVFTAGKTQGYAAQYFPSAATQAAAAPLKITAGETLPLEIALRRRTPITVSGTLAGAPENSYPEIQVFDEDGEEVPARDEDMYRPGQFTLRFTAPGTYTVRITSRTSTNNQVMFGEQKLAVNASVAGVTIALAPTPSFAIHITADQVGTPAQMSVAGGVIAGIAGSQPPTFQNFRLVPLAPSFANEYSSQWNPKTKTNSFPEVMPGVYRFDSYPQGNWYVQSATIAGRDILNEPFQVDSGQSGVIEVTMRDDAGSLAGSINGFVAAPPVAGSYPSASPTPATVLLFSDGRPGAQPQRADAWQGNFQFAGITPGAYKLYAFDRIDQLEYMNPTVLEHYSGTAVSFSPGEQKNVTVNLLHVNP